MPNPVFHPVSHPESLQQIDTLIQARWIVPVEPENVVLENHALAIDRGEILAILPADEARQRYQAKETTLLPQHVLMPGLVNLHTHAAMSLLRGYADDKPLMSWLQDHIWPAESQHVSAQFVRDGTLLAAAEMLRGGVTCFSDMYFFPEAAAEAAHKTGIRAALGLVVFEFPSAYGNDADDYLAKGLAVRDRWREEPTISFCLAPHAPYTVSDRTFERVAMLAGQLDIPVHTHLHETCEEIIESQRLYGMRPLERLHRLGLTTTGLIAAHCIHLEADEIALLAEQGVTIAHCPTSNMKLASGIASIAEAMKQGVNVGLGSDGAASNNRLDMFQEMRHAALLGKVAAMDASVLPAHQVLRMATLNGARALGLGNRIGSLLPGKLADLCAVAITDFMLQPCFDPVSHLIYAAGRENVSHVWVGGEKRLIDATLPDLNMTGLMEAVALWQNSLSASRR
jgi:5-methylthioadenosine/S-adenosylhomocysteine deaminase